MFLTGPGVVREVMGEDVGAAELGGHKVHERNGVCDLVADDDRAAASISRATARPTCRSTPARPPPRARRSTPGAGDPGAAVPDDPRQVYDVRDVDRRRSSTAARCSRSRRAGRATSSPASRGSTAARSA